MGNVNINETITNWYFSIPRYASQGLKKLGLSIKIPDDIFEEAFCVLEQWRQVVIFYSLRLSLSPVVESLILLDRQLYLYEQGLFWIDCIVDWNADFVLILTLFCVKLLSVILQCCFRYIEFLMILLQMYNSQIIKLILVFMPPSIILLWCCPSVSRTVGRSTNSFYSFFKKRLYILNGIWYLDLL